MNDWAEQSQESHVVMDKNQVLATCLQVYGTQPLCRLLLPQGTRHSGACRQVQGSPQGAAAGTWGDFHKSLVHCRTQLQGAVYLHKQQRSFACVPSWGPLDSRAQWAEEGTTPKTGPEECAWLLAPSCLSQSSLPVYTWEVKNLSTCNYTPRPRACVSPWGSCKYLLPAG